SREEILEQGLVSEEDYNLLEKYTYALFKRGSEIAEKRGLILVDTKYEFGKKDGKIYLIDEINTPDSSRYFYLEGYIERLKKGESQKQLSKEFVRQWLIERNFQGKEGQVMPEIPDEFVDQVTERYIELYENIIGEKFVKEESEGVLSRIENNIKKYLESVDK
ncbi:MAG: phosphoribosylaminoimidazolesuccinocarboxamide synthase, partial [Bacteroidales bacterium]